MTHLFLTSFQSFFQKDTCPSTSSKLENQAVSGAASDLSTEFLGAAEGKDAKLLVQSYSDSMWI